MSDPSDPAFETTYGQSATAPQKYALRLYVAGTTSHSVRAIANIKDVCEKYLKERYALEVIDIYQHPQLAKEDQIIAVPSLIRKSPFPQRILVGDLSDTAHLLRGLDLSPL